MNLFTKNRDLILTATGYRTELKLKESDLILTQKGFKPYVKTSLDFYKNYYKISTYFSSFFIPSSKDVAARLSFDFSGEYIYKLYSADKLNIGDYWYLPKYKYTDKKFIKNFSIKRYSLNDHDFSTIRPNIKYFDILQKYFLNKPLSENKIEEVKKYYNTEDLDILYKSLILISSSPLSSLPINDTFMFLVHLCMTKKYTVKNTSLILTDISKDKAEDLDLYFKNVYFDLYKNTNTFYNSSTKQYTLNSYIFTEIFKNNFDSYSFINNISSKLFITLFKLLASDNILHFNNFYSALNLQFICYKNNKLVSVEHNIDNTYTVILNTEDYYIEFKDGYLLEITDKEELTEEFFTTYFTS